MDLGAVTCETFAPYVGNHFQVSLSDAERVSLELVSATAFTNRTDSRLKRVPFCLTFRGPKKPLLPQHIYKFEHEKLGAFEVFAVPVGPDAVGMIYEVQFS